MDSVIPRERGLGERVYDAIVGEICGGVLPAGAHLVQEDLARKFGVSRQPVQQAMALLKADGMVEEIGGRGLRVTPLDLDLVRHHYDIRAALDGFAARKAAARAQDDQAVAQEIFARGSEILGLGNAAVEGSDVTAQVRHDEAFHTLVYDVSGNPLLARTAEPHWRFLRRAMGEVLRHAELPREIWRQHAEILAAIVAGDPGRAERLAVEHDLLAAETLYAALTEREGVVSDQGGPEQ